MPPENREGLQESTLYDCRYNNATYAQPCDRCDRSCRRQESTMDGRDRQVRGAGSASGQSEQPQQYGPGIGPLGTREHGGDATGPPSSLALTDARRDLAEAEQDIACIAYDLHENGMHPDDAADFLAKRCEKLRTAVAALDRALEDQRA